MKTPALTASRVLRPAPLIIISLLLIMVTGCGKKGPVRPKLGTLPQAPQELALKQHGSSLVLSWALPAQNLDGSRIEALSGFRIRRLDYDSETGCPTCREPHVEVAQLDLEEPAPGQRIGNRFYWRDHNIRTHSGYRYAVSSLAGGGESPVATIHRVVQQPPASPTELQSVPGDRQVSLKWLAPILEEEQELVGYNLYRRQDGQTDLIIPINTDPITSTSLLDQGLNNGRSYAYSVSALVRNDNQLLESINTPEILVTPGKSP
jgi:hypothetical protein